MFTILKGAIVTAAVGATMLAAIPSANARDWGRHDDWRRWHHHSNGGDAVALGIAGLAAGALIGGALANQPPPPAYDDYRYDPDYAYRRYPVARPAPVRDYYAGGLQPWTPAWYRYCSDRYQSFNARTGTFTGYDGESHFCVAN